jgi:polysaccharide export outer membrane protein
MAMKFARSATAILTLLLCLIVAGCASNALVSTNPNIHVTGKGLPAPDASQTFAHSDEYRIGSQDLLTITVFSVTDLTQDVRVDSLGKITLPLIGAVQAGGETAIQLQGDIAAKLKNGFLQDPQVSVFIKEYDSQKVTVSGVVKKPGVFPLTGPTSLLQVIATAQGLDDLADHKGVVVFRYIKGEKMAAVFDIDAVGRGAVDDPPIYSDDVVVVAESGSKDALRYIISGASPFYYLFHSITPTGL